MLRVMFLLRKFDPSTGLSKFVVETTRRMNSIEPVLVTNKIRDGMKDDPRISHLKVYEIGGSAGRFLFKWSRIEEIVRKEKIGLINVHGGFLSSLAIPSLAKIGIPIVFTSHTNKLSVGEFRHLFFMDIFREYKLFLDVGDVILSLILPRKCISRSLRNPLLNHVSYPTPSEVSKMRLFLPGMKVSALPSGGVDPSIFKPSVDARNDGTILFFGRARLIRGADVTIRAFEKVHLKYPKLKLQLLLLEDIDSHRIKKMVRNSKARGAIDIQIGENHDINGIIALSTIVVLPFRWPRGMPSHPLTLLEAMSCRCVCISSNVAAIPDIIIDNFNGFLLQNPENPNELVGMIVRAINSNSDEIGNNARDTVIEKYSWQSIAGNLESTLLALAKV